MICSCSITLWCCYNAGRNFCNVFSGSYNILRHLPFCSHWTTQLMSKTFFIKLLAVFWRRSTFVVGTLGVLSRVYGGGGMFPLFKFLQLVNFAFCCRWRHRDCFTPGSRLWCHSLGLVWAPACLCRLNMSKAKCQWLAGLPVLVRSREQEMTSDPDGGVTPPSQIIGLC